MSKLQMLCECEGLSGDLEDEDMQRVLFDSVQPAICMNDGCDYTSSMEPDQDKGWCEICDEGSMKSISVLLGVI